MEEIATIQKEAIRRLDGLAKPVGSLGKLEEVAIQVCVAQRQCPPVLGKAKVIVFAADHGIHVEQVSPFPSSVTKSMVQTMVEGKSTVACLAKHAGARLEVVNVGVNGTVPLGPTKGDFVEYVDACLMHGSKNITEESAMTEEQLDLAIEIGRQAVARAVQEDNAGVVSIGEIGICNTSIASALGCRLLDISADALVGPGTGLDSVGIARKVDAVKRALERGGSRSEDPKSCLRDVGGLEVAAMVGAFLECLDRKIVAVVDGFIATVAALTACKMNPLVEHQLVFSTLSAEPGHRLLLEGFPSRGKSLKPLLDWDLRLGEGSAATLCLPLIQASARLFEDVATLESVLAAANNES